MMLDASVVVPILNEARTLHALLEALRAQTLKPRELVFVDAGSSDGSPGLIRRWWDQYAWQDAHCQVIERPGAMPGDGRNAGVAAARGSWIAFIDGGIRPEPDWLEQLWRYASSEREDAVFGVCLFSAPTPFTKAACALSYGHGASHPVIPASLFARAVFNEVGGFPPGLRAGEDIAWVERLIARRGRRVTCSAARVHYEHFPENWTQALRKWRLFEYHATLGGVRRRQHFFAVTVVPALYLVLLLGGAWGAAIFAAYLLLRGVVSPMRRSADHPWWGRQPGAALIALPLAAALDLARMAGVLQGLLTLSRRKSHS